VTAVNADICMHTYRYVQYADKAEVVAVMSINNKNLSGDKIASVNFFKDDIAHILQNTKKRELTLFNKLDDS